MKKKQIEADSRVKARHFTWRESALTYFILLTLSAGQWMIYNEYVHFGNMPPEFIWGMLGYWAIVTAISVLLPPARRSASLTNP